MNNMSAKLDTIKTISNMLLIVNLQITRLRAMDDELTALIKCIHDLQEIIVPESLMETSHG